MNSFPVDVSDFVKANLHFKPNIILILTLDKFLGTYSSAVIRETVTYEWFYAQTESTHAIHSD